MLIETNTMCVNSSASGHGCYALDRPEKGCLKGNCRFYKTEYQLKVDEAKAKSRCEDLGIDFKPRSEVIEEIDRVSKYWKERQTREKMKHPRSIIKYNSRENDYTEYNSLETASKATGISPEKLELLIRKNEEYGGYKFVYI